MRLLERTPVAASLTPATAGSLTPATAGSLTPATAGCDHAASQLSTGPPQADEEKRHAPAYADQAAMHGSIEHHAHAGYAGDGRRQYQNVSSKRLPVHD